MIGKRLIELRNKKKMTQKEIADKLKISRSTYSNYESDFREPDFKNVEILADIFEVSVDYLLGRETKKPTVSDLELSDDELISKYNVVLDGQPIEDAILREILAYVRVRRSTK